MPAFAITASMPPKRSSVPSTADSSASRLVTSASNHAASPHSAATRLELFGLEPDQREARSTGRQAAGGFGADAARGAR